MYLIVGGGNYEGGGWNILGNLEKGMEDFTKNTQKLHENGGIQWYILKDSIKIFPLAKSNWEGSE